MWASREGCLEDVVFLLSTGVEVNSRGQVRCHCLATTLCHYSFSTQLLDVMNTKHKPQRDSLYVHVQWEGRTALIQASKGGHLGVVKELVGAQAVVDQQDEVRGL